MRAALQIWIALCVVTTVSSVKAEDSQPTSLTLKRPSDGFLETLDATKLRHLNIRDGRDVTDAGFQAIGKFEQLTSLYIHRSAATDRGLAHFSKLKKLRSLNIRLSPQFTEAGLAHLKSLRQLTKLDFSGTVKGKGLLHLKEWRQLRQLQFAAGDLDPDSVKVLAALPKLTSLTLLKGTISKAVMAEIAAIPKLAYLSFYDVTFKDGAAMSLAGCQNLTSLSFRTTQIGDGQLAGIKKLKKLKYLTLYATKVTDAGIDSLSGLPNLAFLNLAYSPEIDGEVVDSLAKFKKLEEVYLNGTGVTKDGGLAIRKALPDLRVEHRLSQMP